jgi:hypothetical protein
MTGGAARHAEGMPTRLFCAGHPLGHAPFLPDARKRRVSAQQSDGTRVPYSTTAGRLPAPGGRETSSRAWPGSPWDLTVPGVAFRHPRAAICVPVRALAAHSDSGMRGA